MESEYNQGQYKMKVQENSHKKVFLGADKAKWSFFLQIGELYDDDPSGLELATEFWCPTDTSLSAPFSPYSSSRISPAIRQRASQKQVGIYNGWGQLQVVQNDEIIIKLSFKLN